MTKLQLSLLAAATLVFAACSQDEDVQPVTPAITDGLEAVEAITADFGAGQMTVSTTSGSSSAKKNVLTRALGDYEDCASFAALAQAVDNPYSYEAAPSVPEDAIDVSEINKSVTFEDGKSYYIDAESTIPQWVDAYGATVYVYLKDGVKLDAPIKTRATVVYYVLEGAELNLTSDLAAYNWGTLTLGSGLQLTHKVFNYGTLNEVTDLRMGNGAVLYSSNDVSAKITYSYGDLPKVYVDGDFKALDGFGAYGDLYVGGDMSGDINIQNGLNVHVMGNVNTTQTAKFSSSQMCVEGDFTGTELQLNAGTEPQLIVKGTASFSGDVHVADGAKGYFELLLCENYTANGSDIWVGCKSDVRNTFELNGPDVKFTLANGVYLHAGNAKFASNSTMVMYGSSFFNVDEKIQMYNVDCVEFKSVALDSETPAIVKAHTLGANYEDFATTFTGNIGVDFEEWDYNGSTGLIDQNVNLKRISDVAAKTEIAESDCNPGYKGDDSDGGGDEPDPTPTPDPTPDPEPEPTPIEGCDVPVEVELGIDGEWIIQADDFAIHNGDILYENVAVTDHTGTGTELEQYVKVNAGENVVVSITDVCALYEYYKALGTNSEGKAYLSAEGILTVEVYLWPAKYNTKADGSVEIVPIPASEFGITADGVEGKYLVGTEEYPETYIMDGKYKVQVSAYQSYNGGGEGADMTSYVKVSFHITPVE